jgi:RNA polymerase sigma factor (sigma-70 family)
LPNPRRIECGRLIRSRFVASRLINFDCTPSLREALTPKGSKYFVPFGRSATIYLLNMNVPDLLARIRENRSEEAFEAVMCRYSGLVYSVAQRRLRDASLAEECTQEVFVRLARMAPRLQSEAELVGWLHATAHRVAIDRWRTETRRRDREQKAALMPLPEPPPDLHWSDVAPLLDEAMNHLSEVDRQAILLRYFQCESVRSVGSALGLSEDATKMRLRRALEKLHLILGRRGITCSAAVLAVLLEKNAVEAALPSLLEGLRAARISSQMGRGAAGVSLLPAGILLMKSKVLVLILAGILGYWWWHQVRSTSSRRAGAETTTASSNSYQRVGRLARLRGSTPFAARPAESAADRLAQLQEVLQGARRIRVYPPGTLWEALAACADIAPEAVRVLSETLASPDYETRHWAVAGLELICQERRFKTGQDAARLALARVAISPVEPDELRNEAMTWAFPRTAGIDLDMPAPEPVATDVLAVFASSFHAKGIEMVSQNMVIAERLNQRLLATGQNYEEYRRQLVELVASGDADQRLGAAYALSGLPGDKPAQVKESLVRALQEDSPRTPTAMAAKALGRLGASAQDALATLLEFRNKHADSDPIRAQAEQAIVAIQPDLLARFPDAGKSVVEDGPTNPTPDAGSVRQNILEPLLAELRDPVRRQQFVLEDHWWKISSVSLVTPLRDAFHQAAEQSDPETAALLEKLAERINPLFSAEEDVPLDQGLPDVQELLGRAEGVTQVPENGIPLGVTEKVRRLASKYGPGLFGPAKTTPEILRQAAADLRQINSELYRAALKSFLEFHPELDRIFR